VSDEHAQISITAFTNAITRQFWSATAISNTLFAKSTATVVAFLSGSFRVALTPTPHQASWHNDAENKPGGVHPIIGADTRRSFVGRQGGSMVLDKISFGDVGTAARRSTWSLGDPSPSCVLLSVRFNENYGVL